MSRGTIILNACLFLFYNETFQCRSVNIKPVKEQGYHNVELKGNIFIFHFENQLVDLKRC